MENEFSGNLQKYMLNSTGLRPSLQSIVTARQFVMPWRGSATKELVIFNFLPAALNLLLGTHYKEADFSVLTYTQSTHRGIFIHMLHARFC